MAFIAVPLRFVEPPEHDGRAAAVVNRSGCLLVGAFSLA
jgi:hypothetical protein